MLENPTEENNFFNDNDRHNFEEIERLAREPDSSEPHAELDEALKSEMSGNKAAESRDVNEPTNEFSTDFMKKAHSDDESLVPSVSFADLHLSDEVKKAVEMAGYQNPTPIQAEIIPHLLVGRDVLAQSQTGTGKTAAFALPILSRIETTDKTPQVLVLAPTRELAIQVCKSFTDYGACLPDLGITSIYGGQDYEIQFRQLRRGPQIVVGTPGRVIDHVKRNTLDLSQIECLVLDEADEMLNMGFLEDVEFILKHTPEDRQIALFSATLPKPIRNISKRYLNDPANVSIKRKTLTADSIRQRAVFVSPRDRVELLTRFLEAENADGSIVFTRTRETTTIVADQLAKSGLSAAALSGDMPQKARERTIERLKAGHLNILVATDIAARGLDISRISHIFNYDLPESSESYTHRIGRTGRAGRTGEAIIFLTHKQRSKLRLIEKTTRQPIEIVEAPTSVQINKMRIQRFKDRIERTIQETDLTFFETMISDVANTTGQSLEKISAAVAHMGQNGRHFLMKDRPIGQRSHKNKNDRGRERRGRFNGPPETGMVRYRISVGKRDGARAGNIVGAVANEAGIDGQSIGPIRIHESYSTIDLPENMPEHIYDTLQDTRVAGRKLKICLATDNDERPARHAHNRSQRNDSKKQNRRGNKSFSSKSRSNFKNKKRGSKKAPR